jgi:sugar O-acyltransferase (sialic acid O-acetyltransferase NeuD family)
MKATYGVYGTGGFGREVMPLVRAQLVGLGMTSFVFVEDSPTVSTKNSYNVLDYESFSRLSGERFVTIAVADGIARRRLSSKCVSDGIQDLSVAAPTARLYDNCEVGPGSILCDFVTLTSDIKIGKYFHANIYGYVAHDCVIGDFVTFAPAVRCNGNVTIEDGAYIGTGAILRQGSPGNPLVIGAGAVVGMGAVVTKNVPEGSTVVGNPAKALVK